MALNLSNKIPSIVTGLTRCGLRNGSSILLRRELPAFQVAKRNASIHTKNWMQRRFHAEHISVFGWALLSIPITTFGLGLWQIERKKWKTAIIKELKEQMNQPVVKLPDDLSDLEKMEYRPVRVRGRFLHDREVYLGPRSLIDDKKTSQKASVFSSANQTSGYQVITPFKLEDREETILVNRGWVPRTKMDPKKRPEGQVTGFVEITGIVRKNEPRPQLMPKSKGSHFLYRDIKRMCELTGADPFYIDATADTTVPGGPIGGQTMVRVRDEHLTYIITWLTLSVSTSVFWYKLIYLVK